MCSPFTAFFPAQASHTSSPLPRKMAAVRSIIALPIFQASYNEGLAHVVSTTIRSTYSRSRCRFAALLFHSRVRENVACRRARRNGKGPFEAGRCRLPPFCPTASTPRYARKPPHWGVLTKRMSAIRSFALNAAGSSTQAVLLRCKPANELARQARPAMTSLLDHLVGGGKLRGWPFPSHQNG